MAENPDKMGLCPYPWVVRRTNPEFVSYLSRAVPVSPALAQVLINRGVKTPGEVSDFFSPSMAGLPDPLSMGGVGRAAEVIHGARKSGARVLVHGDYDADGVTATALMVEALREIGLDVSHYIPNRFNEGYGFNIPGVEAAKRHGAGLIITVDCGVTSFEAAEYAKKSGIGLIITDHHQAAGGIAPLSFGEASLSTGAAPSPPRLPDALSVVNPTLEGGPQLSGAGVALKLAMALLPEEGWRGLLDLAALGTVADSMPLIGENRAIVKEGLSEINAGQRAGIRALRDVSGAGGGGLRAETLSFTLVPRINAAGRIADPSEALELLLSKSDDKAAAIAASLDRRNSERQRIEEDIMSEALEQVKDKGGCGGLVVLWGEGWHEGVIGIVASKLTDRFDRPAFVFSVKDGVAKGSARGIPGFDVHGSLSKVSDLLLTFGGHKEAAGLRLKSSELDLFERRMSEIAMRSAAGFSRTLDIDADIELGDISFNFMRELEMFEPLGAGNPEPVFGTKGLRAVSPRVVGNNHLKLRLKSASRTMDAIGFDMGGLCERLEKVELLDAAYRATINEWEGGRTLQLNLKALRESKTF